MWYTKSKIINQKSKRKYKNNFYTSIKKNNKSKEKKLSLNNSFIILGLIFLFFGLLIFFFTFFPVVKEELKYQVVLKNQSKDKKEKIKPVDEDFGIVIPKIGANSKVIAQVNPFDEKEYQQALTKGVAHAKNSALPDIFGNTFIFAHSSADWYTTNRYNSVFYLLGKLDKNDEIYLYYQKQKYLYKVIEKKVVDPSELNYLKGEAKEKTLTLMTCWPAGTNLKRLIVIAKLTF